MRVSDERLAELREKHLRDAARLSRHDVLAGPHRELVALLTELQEHRVWEAASREEWAYAVEPYERAATEVYESREFLEAESIWDRWFSATPGARVVRRLVGPWEVIDGE